MYAIVDIAGQQFKVEKEQEVFVHRLEGDEGSTVEFDNVLLFDNDGKVSVGTPNVKGVKITAKIVEHMKADKVIVFHKKRRKGYQKQNGHRQYMSKLLIEDILTGVTKKETKAKETPKVEKKEAKANPEASGEVKAVKETKAKATPKTATKKTTETKAEKPKAVAPKIEKPKAEAQKKEEAPKAEVKKEVKPKAEKKENKEDKKED